jgi:fumarate hydratase class II
LALCTALVPRLGYDQTASISHEAATSGKTIREVARATTDLTEGELDELLDPAKMTEPGL